jgi:hypothetical protein
MKALAVELHSLRPQSAALTAQDALQGKAPTGWQIGHDSEDFEDKTPRWTIQTGIK